MPGEKDHIIHRIRSLSSTLEGISEAFWWRQPWLAFGVLDMGCWMLLTDEGTAWWVFLSLLAMLQLGAFFGPFSNIYFCEGQFFTSSGFFGEHRIFDSQIILVVSLSHRFLII